MQIRSGIHSGIGNDFCMFAPNLHSSFTFTSSNLGTRWILQGVEAVLDGLQTDVAANLGALRSKENSQC